MTTKLLTYNEVKADLSVKTTIELFDVVIHGCNCFCTWGAGYAKALKETIPEAYEADLRTEKGYRNKLGYYSTTTVDGVIYINAYTQYEYSRDKTCVDYEAVRNVFKLIKKNFGNKHKKFGMVKIGAGLGGGDWDIIREIIQDELYNEDVTVCYI